MADPAHLEILRGGVKEWNSWRKRHPNIRPDLSSAQLNGVSLKEADLATTDLSCANLQGTDLASAKLFRADLQFANLEDAGGLERVERSLARNMVLACYSPEILRRLDLPPQHNNRLHQKDLSEYHCPGLDFSMAKLSDFVLTGTVFTDCSFFGADLNGTNLAGADLRFCVLEGANLSGANLSHARLTYSNLRRARMCRSTLARADIRAADFLEADVYNADFREVSFTWRDQEPDLFRSRNYIFIYCSASLSDAMGLRPLIDQAPHKQLECLAQQECRAGEEPNGDTGHNERIRSRSLAGYDFSNLKLEQLDLSGWDLSGSRCGDTSFVGSDLRGCNLSDALMAGAKLAHVNLSDANLDRASLRGADLHEAIVQGSRLTGATVDAANLCRANFTGSDLTGARLSGAKAEGAIFAKANLKGCDLVAANFVGADFSGATLDDSDFGGARLTGARLPCSSLRSTKWSDADLSGANLEHANIQSADFRGAVGLVRDAILSACNYRLAMYGGELFNTLGFQTAIDQHNECIKSRQFSQMNFSGCDLTGADLDGAILEDAILIRTVLNGASLKGAKLMRATLSFAALQNANLESADLTSAVLKGASLDGCRAENAILVNADLSGKTSLIAASFCRANMTGALLRDAVLEGADLETAVGLYSDQFAATNINSAKLPAELGRFSALANIEGITASARGLVLTTILLCGYSAIQVISITDGDLLANRTILSSPLLDMHTPVVFFCFGGPLVLLAVYLWAHFYLQHLWEELAKLPAIFQDSRPIYKKVYPWFLNAFVSAHFPILKKDRPLLTHIQIGCTVAITWWLVPGTIVLLWAKYLRVHDKVGTGFQFGVLLISMVSAAFLQYLAGSTLRGEFRRPIKFYRPNPTQVRISAVLLIMSIAMFVFGWGAIDGCAVTSTRVGPVYQRIVHLWSDACIVAQLSRAEISTKNSGWRGAEESLVTGARLARRNLRRASGSGAFLAKADLEKAYLEDADFSLADFRWANLSGAHLEQARLAGARLKLANLPASDLRGADLRKADLRCADLRGADLRGADLREADLTKAYVDGAQIQGANFRGAILREVFGLTKPSLETIISKVGVSGDLGSSVSPRPIDVMNEEDACRTTQK